MVDRRTNKLDYATPAADREPGKIDDPAPIAVRDPNAAKTLLRVMIVLVLLGVAVTGMVYAAWMLWTLPAKP